MIANVGIEVRNISAQQRQITDTISVSRRGLVCASQTMAALFASRNYLPQFLRGEPLFSCADGSVR